MRAARMNGPARDLQGTSSAHWPDSREGSDPFPDPEWIRQETVGQTGPNWARVERGRCDEEHVILMPSQQWLEQGCGATRALKIA
jgi:hypothetical protein